MSKIIPIFYLPKEYEEDIRILSEGLVANNGQSLKAVTFFWKSSADWTAIFDHSQTPNATRYGKR